MKTIHVEKPFRLSLGQEVINVGAGIQSVSDEIADHWYTKAHLSNGGLGAPAYAEATRASADSAFVRVKEAVAAYVSLEKAALDAEVAAGLAPSEPAYSRLPGVLDPDHELAGQLLAARDAYDQAKANSEPDPEANPETGEPPIPPTPKDDGLDARTDEELRELVKEQTGRTPHPATGRDKLLAAARGGPAADEEPEDPDPAKGAEQA